jgi:hypothetical protein
MSKQRFAILFLLAANICMLAHTVVPHHHHNGVPHFDLTFSAVHNDGCDCCCTDDCHHHHDNDQPEPCDHQHDSDCLFDRDFDAIRDNPDDNSRCACSLCTAHHHHFLTLFTGFDYKNITPLLTAQYVLVDPPYLINYHCDCSASSGLRAPPTA